MRPIAAKERSECKITANQSRKKSGHSVEGLFGACLASMDKGSLNVQQKTSLPRCSFPRVLSNKRLPGSRTSHCNLAALSNNIAHLWLPAPMKGVPVRLRNVLISHDQDAATATHSQA
eukprot:scaffold87128_cov17-Tisochrysis_lutea.AAC.1